MKKLYVRLITLIAYLILIFNITRLNIQGNRILYIHPYFYILTSMSVLSIITIPALRRSKTSGLLVGGAILYIMGNLYFHQETLLEDTYLYATATEVFLLFSAIFLTSRVSTSLNNIQNVLETILFPHINRTVYEENQAEKIIEREFARSRRGNHPIATMIVRLDPEIENLPKSPAIDEILNDLKKRFLYAKLTKLISSQARTTDMIIQAIDKDQLIVISPETNTEQSLTLANRLITFAKNQLDIDLAFGVASFPQDGQTYSSTREQAESNLAQSYTMNFEQVSEQVDQTSN